MGAAGNGRNAGFAATPSRSRSAKGPAPSTSPQAVYGGAEVM